MYWNVYIIPILASALILLILFFLLLQLRNSKGALLFSFVTFCFFIYAVGYGLVISSYSLEKALLFFKIERIGAGLIPSFYMIFAVSYIEKYNLLRKSFIPLYFIIPIIAIGLLLTNQSHNLFYSNPLIERGSLFVTLSYNPGIWYYILQFYILLCSLIVNIVLITLFVTGSSVYRKQIGTIVVGSLSMIILHTLLHPNMLGLFDLKINPTPFFSSISGIIIYIGLIRYNLFRFVPVVRDTIFEKMADAVIVLDKNLILVDFNHNASAYLNINKKDIGKAAAEVLSFWVPLNCNSKNVRLRNDFEYKTNVNNVTAFFQINISPYYDKKEIFQGQIIVMRDITVQKEAEKILDSQTRLINTMLDNLPIGIFMVEAKTGKPLIANNRAKELLGRGILPDVTNKNLSEVYQAYISGTNERYPDNQMPIIRGMLGESSHIDNMEVQRPDGHRVPLEIFGCPVLDASNNIVASLVGFFDITERIESEAKIQKQNEDLRELNATKDKFFSIIAHDLKSPFNAVLGFSDLLQKHIDDFEKEEIKEHSSTIHKAAMQAYKLVENLLEWSRIQRGLIKFEPQKVNLTNLVHESIEPLLESANKKSIAIRKALQSETDVYADIRMVATILRNLISNAIKFTPRNGSIEISAITNEKGNIEITIIDSGIGMEHEILENLFKIDAKVNRQGTEGEPSTGLGLLLCKEFIEKHQGDLWVESEVGKGSTFHFSLPKGD